MDFPTPPPQLEGVFFFQSLIFGVAQISLVNPQYRTCLRKSSTCRSQEDYEWSVVPSGAKVKVYARDPLEMGGEVDLQFCGLNLPKYGSFEF